MTPCDAALWVYDIASDEWRRVDPQGDRPEERSYHCMAVTGDRLFRTFQSSAFFRSPENARETG